LVGKTTKSQFLPLPLLLLGPAIYSEADQQLT
jgi:hypothetical protein